MNVIQDQRMELLLEYDERIARLERELANAVAERKPPEMLNVARNFIKKQREHRDVVWYYAKAEGITEREYAQWKQTHQTAKGRASV